MRHALLPAAVAAFGLLLQPAHAEDHAHTVRVDGTASVMAAPDMAQVSIAVSERSMDLEAARKQAAAVTARVLALTDQLGIDRKQVNTTGASVQPNYRWNRERDEQELTGYTVARNMLIEVRDLEQLGPLVEGAVKAGVNQVAPPALDSSKRRDIYRQALAAAAGDARRNAETLAVSLGAKLGPAISIDAGSQPPMPLLKMRMASADMALAESAPETYNAGGLQFDANVSVLFELLVD